MSVQDRAHRALVLLKDETFQEFLEGTRRDQDKVFRSPSSSGDEIRDARDIIMALHKLEAKLHSAVSEGQRAAKRKL